jgi:hypothetical protein
LFDGVRRQRTIANQILHEDAIGKGASSKMGFEVQWNGKPG